MNKLFFVILSLLSLNSCQPTSRIYRENDKGKVTIGKLPEEAVAIIKQHLFNITKQELKDTILIKYEYNNETCWSISDMIYKDSVIESMIKSRITYHQTQLLKRHQVSYYHFRQPGNSFNKLVGKDKNILIDKDLVLNKLLFSEITTCGSSIIIMPDGYFILTKSDSHQQFLSYSSATINKMLSDFNKKKQKAL